MYCNQHCFICRPSDSTVSEDAGIEPRTVATLALAVRRSNNSARSLALHCEKDVDMRRHLLCCQVAAWSVSSVMLGLIHALPTAQVKICITDSNCVG
jgi:hypothetical protein